LEVDGGKSSEVGTDGFDGHLDCLGSSDTLGVQALEFVVLGKYDEWNLDFEEPKLEGRDDDGQVIALDDLAIQMPRTIECLSEVMLGGEGRLVQPDLATFYQRDRREQGLRDNVDAQDSPASGRPADASVMCSRRNETIGGILLVEVFVSSNLRRSIPNVWSDGSE
jgi:hypothetical protein